MSARIVSFALFLILCIPSWGRAQSPECEAAAERARRATALKSAVDEVLARRVRALRAELHALIDQALEAPGRTVDLDHLLAEMEGSPPQPTPPAGVPAEVQGVDSSASGADLEARIRRLEGLLAADHPTILALKARLAKRKAAFQDPWSVLGLTLAPQAIGMRVVAVQPGSAAANAGLHKGATLVRAAGLPIAAATASDVGRILGLRFGAGVELQIEGRGVRGDTGHWTLRPAAASVEEIDPEKLIDSLRQRALDRVVPTDPAGGPDSGSEATPLSRSAGVFRRADR